MQTLNQLITFSSIVLLLQLSGPILIKSLGAHISLTNSGIFGKYGMFHLQHSVKESWNLLVRSLTLNVWLARNNCIFNHKTPNLCSTIFEHTPNFVFWVLTSLTNKRHKLESSSVAVKTIHFPGSHTGDKHDPKTQALAPTPG